MNTHIRAFRRAAHSLDHLKHAETDDRPRVSSNFMRGLAIAIPISVVLWAILIGGIYGSYVAIGIIGGW